MTTTGRVCTQIEVSWSGDGLYDGPYDDVTPFVAADPGLSITIGKDGLRTLDPPQVGAVDFEVANDTGRFSQEWPGSPLYQRIIPGRPVRVTCRIGESDLYRGTDAYRADDPYRGIASYAMADAAIDQIAQTAGWGKERVAFGCLGIEQVLVAGTVTIGVMTTPRVDQCVTAILDAVGWPTDARDVAVADTTLTSWWCDDREPWSALVELLLSEGPGAMYVANGVFHFENRNYRTTAPRATESQAIFFETARTSTDSVYREPDPYRAHDLYRGEVASLWYADLAYEPGYRAIRNRATYATSQRTAAALGVVWTHGSTVVLGSGASTALTIQPSDPFVGAVVPVAGTDYAVGGGTVSMSLSATSGPRTTLFIAATGGTPTVSGLQLRAQALVAATAATVSNGVDASDSIARFSPIPGADIPRVFDVQGWPEILQANAVAVCDAWVLRYMVQRPALTITLVNADDDHCLEIFNRTVSDRISIRNDRLGLATDVWINGKTVTIEGAGGRRVTAVLRTEKVDEVVGDVWDRAVWDVSLWGV